jgi:Heparinase II/III N-terminus/Heparinase II/III-like protein
MKSNLKLLVTITLFIIFPLLTNAAEILYEKGWTRIVSGDKVVQLTREINEQPNPLDINEEILKIIFDRLDYSELNISQQNAFVKGIKLYGWAQLENEPEHETYHVIQIIVVKNKKNEIIIRNYNLQGQISEARFNIKGKQKFFKKIENPEILNRDVFYTVQNPALFVLMQEHFQKQFFEETLNLEYPGFEKVKKAYETEKNLLAAHEVAEYFRRVDHPIWMNNALRNNAVKTSSSRKAERDAAADKVLKHEFTYDGQIIQMGERIDYSNNPTNNLEWIWGLNRMKHWVTLLSGYEKTVNEEYAKEFNRDVIDWVVRNPAPTFRLTRVPSWRNLEVGDRIAGSFSKSFFGFLSSPSFKTQTIQLMLMSIWSHANHIERFPSGLNFVSNWSIIESNGLTLAGMYFPEFQNSEYWSDLGFQRLLSQMKKQVYPDGVHHELTTNYHIYSLSKFYQTYNVSRKLGKSVPKNYVDMLEKMTEYLMYISSPSRKTPPTNDAYRNDIRGEMKNAAVNFNREDMLYIATDCKEGTQPELTSVQFPWAGQSVMRSGWESDAWYLFFDAGPTGVNHQNEDKLNIDISAFGRLFLSEAGIVNYIPDKWRRYFTSTQAHNTIIIDGKGQKRMQQKETHRADSPLKNRWISNKNIDFASGTFDDGYGTELISVSHSRYVIFKKKEYWLMLDLLTGEGEHEFKNLFHFAPCDVEFNKQENSIQTLYKDNKNIKLVSNATAKMNIEIVEGSENPEQGWMAIKHGEKAAAPTAIFSGRSEFPVIIVTVIQPYSGENIPDVQIEILESSTKQAQIIVHSKYGDDEWNINLENENSISLNGISENLAIDFTRTKNSKIMKKFNCAF